MNALPVTAPLVVSNKTNLARSDGSGNGEILTFNPHNKTRWWPLQTSHRVNGLVQLSLNYFAILAAFTVPLHLNLS